jgi:hypothetical protein
MNLTININIPEKSASDTPLSQLTPRHSDPPKDLDGKGVIALQGPPISILLFLLTRATTTAKTDINPAMVLSSTEKANLYQNKPFYETFDKYGKDVGNSLDVCLLFFDQYLKDNPGLVQSFQDVQKMFVAYKKFCTKSGFWDDSCDLKYNQQAYIAQIDWTNLP